MTGWDSSRSDERLWQAKLSDMVSSSEIPAGGLLSGPALSVSGTYTHTHRHAHAPAFLHNFAVSKETTRCSPRSPAPMAG